MNKVRCHKCDQKLKHCDFNIALPDLVRMNSRWGKLPRSERNIENLIKIGIDESGGSREEVEEYVKHYMGHNCPKKTRDCPECGKQLKTWRAKMCLECGAEFKPLVSHAKNT